MALNINREVEDTFYRYKMPKLSAKVEGKGNGIKTVIVNVTDIAKALSRKPIYVTKFFGCELGAQIYVDEKNERYIVNGAHEAAKLQELLHGFIKKFVLCQSCANPETIMHVQRKSGTVSTSCKACGAVGHLDVTHRLTQFIVKNPPDPETALTSGKSKRSKKIKGNDKSGDPDPNNDCDDGQHSSTNGADDDEDWMEETTEEAQLQRMNELSGMARSLALSVGTEKTETERANIYCTHLSQMREKNEVISKRLELKKEADELDLGPKVVLILAEALLNNPENMVSDIRKYAPFFVLFTRTGDNQLRAQQYALNAMVKLIERFEKQNLLIKACHMLKQLYDTDIIEEETILAWADKGPSKRVVSKELSAKILEICTPMIKWLREAEVEDSDESDGEDTSKHSSESVSKVAKGCNGSTSGRVSEDEEIDIDAI